jgi:tetratricopeptide (TPR) repeat protein
VRLAVTLELAAIPLYRTPQLDSFEFLTWAQSIVAKAPIAIPTHAPGYAHWLALWLGLFDGSVLAARLVQAAVGAVLCVMVALLGARSFGPRAGLLGGAVLALHGPLAFVESGLLAEGPFLFLLASALVVLGAGRRRPAAAGVAGLLLGLATAFRATAVALVPAWLAAIALDRRRERRLGAAVALLAGWLVVTLPVARSFGARFEVPFFLQGFGGLNLLMGNDPAGSGVPTARLGGAWDRLAGEAYRQGATGVAEREAFYVRAARERIREDPAGFARVLASKAVWLTQAEEPRETHSLHFFRRQSWTLRLLPGFGFLLALAAAGLFPARRARALAPELLAYLAAMAATCVLVIVSLRYRLPLVPALAVLAGAALDWLVERLRERDWRRAGLWGAVVVLVLVGSHLRSHAPSRNLAEEWALTGSSLEREGSLDDAAGAYRRALDADPASGVAWSGLGRVALRRGDLEEAERAFRQSIAADPDFSRGHAGLGAVLWQRGDLDGAAAAYRRGLALAPDAPAIAHDLARLSMDRGELEEAAAVHRQALEFDRNDLVALLGLARVEGARQRWTEGLEAARRAADVAPGESQAWVLVSTLSTEAGDLDAAERALLRAEALAGPGDPAVRYARALLLHRRGDVAAAAAILESLRAESAPGVSGEPGPGAD